MTLTRKGQAMTDKQKKKLSDGREYRNMVLETRESEDESYIVEGYATTFDEAYTLYDMGDVRVNEVVDRNAFNDCDMSDVIFQYNHEGRVYARQSNDTLKLTVDEHGLHVRADLGGTETGRQLYEEIKGGYTNKMSFGFIVAEDKEGRDKVENVDVHTRTITRISKLFDVSAVSIPANDMTEISARDYSDGVIAGIETERSKRERDMKLLKLKLKLMEV